MRRLSDAGSGAEGNKAYREALLKLRGKTLLPVVECRMNNAVLDKKLKSGPRINFHLIFNPDIPADDIETCLKSLKVKGKNFNITNDNDVLDISDILDATSYSHAVVAITDWVEITDSGSDSIVRVDHDGTGGTYSMTQIATLESITGLTDEAALVSSGNLLAA